MKRPFVLRPSSCGGANPAAGHEEPSRVARYDTHRLSADGARPGRFHSSTDTPQKTPAPATCRGSSSMKRSFVRNLLAILALVVAALLVPGHLMSRAPAAESITGSACAKAHGRAAATIDRRTVGGRDQGENSARARSSSASGRTNFRRGSSCKRASSTAKGAKNPSCSTCLSPNSSNSRSPA